MTKLKKPIVLTITHVENAVLLMIIGTNRICQGREETLAKNCSLGEVNHALEAALKSQGIDYRTWEPPQPLLIDGCQVTATEDGSIRVNGVTVPRPTLEAILALSSEAMGKAEPEWPKWYSTDVWSAKVIRFDSISAFGIWHHTNGRLVESSFYRHENATEKEGFKPLTPLQAREILAGNSKEQPK